MSYQQNTLITHIATLQCFIFILWIKLCQDYLLLSYHSGVVVRVFDSDAEIPVAGRVRVPLEVGVAVSLTVLEMFLSLRGLVNKGTYTVELLQKINNTNFFLKFFNSNQSSLPVNSYIKYTIIFLESSIILTSAYIIIKMVFLFISFYVM